MWSAQHSISSDVSAEAVWKVWSDVENWPKWDKGLAWCHLEGEFSQGAAYTLKPVDGPATRASITRCDPQAGFSDVTHLPLAKLEFEHEITQQSNCVRITHRIKISGPLGFFFAKVIGEQTAKDFPQTMSNLLLRAKELE